MFNFRRPPGNVDEHLVPVQVSDKKCFLNELQNAIHITEQTISGLKRRYETINVWMEQIARLNDLIQRDEETFAFGSDAITNEQKSIVTKYFEN